jgi:hypothetical protein
MCSIVWGDQGTDIYMGMNSTGVALEKNLAVQYSVQLEIAPRPGCQVCLGTHRHNYQIGQ